MKTKIEPYCPRCKVYMLDEKIRYCPLCGTHTGVKTND
jgi:rRNA maturation protein Nop10